MIKNGILPFLAQDSPSPKKMVTRLKQKTNFRDLLGKTNFFEKKVALMKKYSAPKVESTHASILGE